MNTRQKNNRYSRKGGFTLIELLVSIFIIGLIASVTVYNHREFTDSLEITNLAYAMALSIREAQISGTAVRGVSDDFESAYGIHFNINDPDDGNFPGQNKAYILFRDVNGDEKVYGTISVLNYDGFSNCGNLTLNPECIQQIDIGRGNFISKICAKESNGDRTCSDTSAPSGLKGVDLTFLRPKLDTNVRFRKENATIMMPFDDFKDKEAIICLKSPIGRTKSINILHTGQVSVGKDPACD